MLKHFYIFFVIYYNAQTENERMLEVSVFVLYNKVIRYMY